jgi:hypothetical protein
MTASAVSVPAAGAAHGREHDPTALPKPCALSVRRWRLAICALCSTLRCQVASAFQVKVKPHRGQEAVVALFEGSLS